MSEFAAVEEEKQKHEPLLECADLLELVDAAAFFPFDPVVAFVSNPPSPPLSPSLSHIAYSLSLPPSPLWNFDDAQDVADETAGNFDSLKGDSDVQNEMVSSIPILAENERLDTSSVIKGRMTQALTYFKEWTNQHVLVQVWAPVKNGDQYVLTTSGQPFVLDSHNYGLLQYRAFSSMYLFSVDGSGDGALGLPGRVFRQKLPEWTPNVQYYSSKEYPRLNHAIQCNVKGTLALPVFESSRQSCVGVVELIMTSQKINYAPEVDKVYKALQAVNLRSCEIFEHSNYQICNEGCQAALAEILEILTLVCDAHKLPLGQTWVPCQHGSVLAHHDGFRKSCSSFDGSFMGQVCISTTDVAFYVIDAHMLGFRDACSEHHLQKGEGVAGRAFASRRACFCSDITKFCKTEYPLVHYARMFGLESCLALCLRSSHSGDYVYVVELFLPSGCQYELLESILMLMKQTFRSLKVITGLELQEGQFLEMIDMITHDNLKLKPAFLGSEKNTTMPLCGNGSISTLSVGTNRPLKRKRGKAEKKISLEVLEKYFPESLKHAAKSLGVCPSTMKRICRHHGISRWPSRKINKVNRSLSKLKRVIESVHDAEGTLDLNSMVCPLPVAAGSLPLSAYPDGFAPNKCSVARIEDSPQRKTTEGDDTDQKLTSGKEVDIQTSTNLESLSSTEGSMEVCLGTHLPSPKDQNMAALLSTPDMISAAEQANVDMLLKDSGSSKIIRNLPPPSSLKPRFITIKACYREDIIRFRLARGSGIVALNEEIAKRLRMEVGTFDIKYLDDDKEWVKLSCDADLKEWIEVTEMSGAQIIRLWVDDIFARLENSSDSSCKL